MAVEIWCPKTQPCNIYRLYKTNESCNILSPLSSSFCSSSIDHTALEWYELCIYNNNYFLSNKSFQNSSILPTACSTPEQTVVTTITSLSVTQGRTIQHNQETTLRVMSIGNHNTKPAFNTIF